jgi:hypothetical protein
MAFRAKVVNTTTSDTLISQMPSNGEGAVHGLVICNNNAEARYATVKFYDASSSTMNTIVSSFLIPAFSQYTWPKPINLEPNDALYIAGADLVVLHSTYEGVAKPAAKGFSGKGAWVPGEYEENDVVSHMGNSYLANETTSEEPPHATWTLLAEKGVATIDQLIRKPVPTTAVTGGGNVAPNGPFSGRPYASVYSSDTRLHRRFEITLASDPDFLSPIFTAEVNSDSTFVDPALPIETAILWRMKDVSVIGEESEWSDVQSVSTKNLAVVVPTVTIQGAFSTVGRMPLLSTSAFQTSPDPSDTHESTSWEIRRTDNNDLLWSSYNNTTYKLSIFPPHDVLPVNTQITVRAKHHSTLYGESDWGVATGQTLPTFSDILLPPVAIGNESTIGHSFQAQTLIDDDTFVIARKIIPQNITSTTFTTNLTLCIHQRVNGVLTPLESSRVVVSNEVGTIGASLGQNDDFAVDMLTPSLGIVIYISFNSNAATPQQFIAARAFSVSGGVITLGAEVKLLTQTGAGRIYSATIARLNDDLAMVAYRHGSSTSSFAISMVALKVLALSITAGAIASFGGGSVDAVACPINITRLTNNTCVVSGSQGTAGSYTFDLRHESVNTSTLAITQGTMVQRTSVTLTTPQIVLVKTGLLLAALQESSASKYLPITITGTTLAFVTTAGRYIDSTDGFAWTDRRAAMARLDDTRVLVVSNASARVITVTDSATTQGSVYALGYSIASTLYSTTRLTDEDLAARFDMFITDTKNLSHSRLRVVNNDIFPEPPISILYRDLTNYHNTGGSLDGSPVCLSSTRAACITIDTATPTGAARLRLRLYDISQDTPSLLHTATIPESQVSTHIIVFTENRLVVLTNSNGYLFSIVNDQLILLDTKALLLTTGTSHLWAAAKTSDTSAVIARGNASNGMLSGISIAGDVITSEAPVTFTASTPTRVGICALTPTKLICVSHTSTTAVFASYVERAGGVWQVITADQASPNHFYSGNSSLLKLHPIDENRALLNHMDATTVSTHNMRIISLSGSTITFGSVRQVTNTVAGANSNYVVPVSPTEGLLFTHITTGLEVHKFVINSGTSAPGVPVKLMDINLTSATSYAPAVRGIVAKTPVAGPDFSAMVLIQHRNNGNGNNSDILMQKFVRGTV